MRAFIFLAILAVTCHQVFSDEIKCAFGSGSCTAKYTDLLIGDKTCDQKAPLFACLRDAGCSRDDQTYKAQVTAYKYESCGASAIIMGWTLPILMFTVAKYFFK
ncbi:hypothetical protein LOTGIDRAFT_238414 [Lottia gigantea]|uniref:Uncharacterized protein n=1 Tax=Lottia gigantea TaxID=225164 RepID=V4AAE0_LOTGI|nr:hypothetical protein LOTGIDRAFT_238414 [Lottia gigantea]ESP00929.1 hypothetical protein LOTGIDRAFT_238414 [Lottia gigantea]